MCLALQEEKKEDDFDGLVVSGEGSHTSETKLGQHEKNREDLGRKQEILQIVLSSIRKHCSAMSPHREIRTIGAALDTGTDQLVGTVLSGGYTNYSYKIYLENSPSCRPLFAKACFSAALWDQGEEKHYYDLERQTTEFRLMEHFQETLVLQDSSGNSYAPVATPYLLLDASTAEGEHMRILVTEWSSTDEQWANQFVEGRVDRRVVAGVAKTMATIHLTEDTTFDRALNQGMKDGLNGMMKEFDAKVAAIFDDLPNRKRDDCLVELERLGRDRVLAIMAGMHEADQQKEVLAHADAHVFNWLVERNPDPRNPSRFGPTGSFCLVDFEMTHWTAKGRDVGLLYSFPIAAAYFRAAQGHAGQAMDMIDCLRAHWDVYSKELRNHGNKTDQYLAETFRSALGFCGLFLFAVHYTSGFQVELLRRGDLSEEEDRRVMGLIGRTGIQLMELAFMDDINQATLDCKGLWALLDDTIDSDMAQLLSFSWSRSLVYVHVYSVLAQPETAC